MMGGIVGGRNTRVEWKDHVSSNTNQSTFNANVDFGNPSQRRWIIITFRCTVLGANNNAPHACTIGGVTATLVFPPPDIALVHRQIWIAQVPTGSSGVVSITRAGNMTGQVLNVWAAYDLSSAVAVDTKASTFSNPASVSLTMQAGGVGIACSDGLSSPSGWAWTGLVEDVEGAIGTLGYSAASLSKATAGALSVQATTTVNNTIIAASFR